MTDSNAEPPAPYKTKFISPDLTIPEEASLGRKTRSFDQTTPFALPEVSPLSSPHWPLGFSPVSDRAVIGISECKHLGGFREGECFLPHVFRWIVGWEHGVQIPNPTESESGRKLRQVCISNPLSLGFEYFLVLETRWTRGRNSTKSEVVPGTDGGRKEKKGVASTLKEKLKQLTKSKSIEETTTAESAAVAGINVSFSCLYLFFLGNQIR